jgi:hypothetical protein
MMKEILHMVQSKACGIEHFMRDQISYSNGSGYYSQVRSPLSTGDESAVVLFQKVPIAAEH